MSEIDNLEDMFKDKQFLLEDPYTAKWMAERILQQINKFEDSLPDNMETVVKLLSPAGAVTLRVESIGYHNPDMITIRGFDQKNALVCILQHTSQLNLLLATAPRRGDLSKPRRKIGFALNEAPGQ